MFTDDGLCFLEF